MTWWREANWEVDFVLRKGRSLVALEVKSSRRRDSLPGLDIFFARRNPTVRRLLVAAPGAAKPRGLGRVGPEVPPG